MRALDRLGTVRVALTVLTAITGLYFALVAFGNITDYATNEQFVKHVLAMDTTFNDPNVMWRSITNQTVVAIAYAAIIVWETLTALVLIGSFIAWFGRTTKTARSLCVLGWVMAIALFGGGFIVIGGEWFQMWESSKWNGLQPALQNFLIASVGLILAAVFTAKPQEEQVEV